MKKNLLTYLLLTSVLLLTGCAAVSKWTTAQANCAADPACLEEAKRYAQVGQAVASPWGPIAVGASGSCILFVALGILGLKKGDKK
jgi:hypothetical protein